MAREQPREETGRVLALAAGLWGFVAGIAALEGAFARFDPRSLAILAALVSVFAVASYFLDSQLRRYAMEMPAARSASIAAGFAAALAMALALGSAPFAMWLAPLASMSVVAVLTRPRGAARSSSPAKSPGARPAAT